MRLPPLLLLALSPPLLLAEEPKAKTNDLPERQPTEFIRLEESEDGSKAELQVALASYRNPDGVLVDLVGAVHIGDAEYYDDLNKRFETYDAVLFEMVGGHDGMTNEEFSRRQSPISFLQNLMKNGLGLEFQLQAVEYGKDNFLHADMSAEDFAEEQRESGQGLLRLLQRAAEEQTRIMAEDPEAVPQLTMPELFRILASPDSTTEFKFLFAKQMLIAENLVDALESDGETVLIGGRNRVALERMRKAIANGKRRIAIFYGAAHLRGMEKTLREEDGFRLLKTVYLSAWKMERRKATPEAKPEPEPMLKPEPAPAAAK